MAPSAPLRNLLASAKQHRQQDQRAHRSQSTNSPSHHQHRRLRKHHGRLPVPTPHPFLLGRAIVQLHQRVLKPNAIATAALKKHFKHDLPIGGEALGRALKAESLLSRYHYLSDDDMAQQIIPERLVDKDGKAMSRKSLIVIARSSSWTACLDSQRPSG
jgi:hypothetical protein